jgi:hypothetical protein
MPSAFEAVRIRRCGPVGIAMYYASRYDDWVTVEECAERLGLTPQRVMELVEQRVLRSSWDGGLVVQPAIVRGYTT